MHRRLAGGEPRTKISLYQGVLRSRRFELVLQKCTELGVVEFVPTIADRCVVSDLDAVDKKRRRWEWIIQEAAEQCRRGRKPSLRPALLFPRACEEAMHSGGLSIILWEGEDEVGLGALLREVPRDPEETWPPFSINLFVGPEGGFTTDEITIAQRYGLAPVSLGARILRSETAGIAATAAVLYALGDLGSASVDGFTPSDEPHRRQRFEFVELSKSTSATGRVPALVQVQVRALVRALVLAPALDYLSKVDKGRAILHED